MDSDPASPVLPSPDPPEGRATPREPIAVQARHFLIQQGMTLAGSVADLSLGGCRLRMEKDCRVQPRCTVEVIFKVNGISFRLFGMTQWIEGKRLIGIGFGQMPDRRRAELAEVIEELAAKREAKAAAELAGAASASPSQADSEKSPRPTPSKPAENRESRLSGDRNLPRAGDNPSGLRVVDRTHLSPSVAPQPTRLRNLPTAPARSEGRRV